MANEKVINAGSGSIFNQIFMSHMFSIARYFYKNPPTSTNLFKLPDNLSIDNSIEPIQREWKKQLEKESPSFFWALFNAYKSYTIITIFCMGIVLNCYAFSSILIKFLLDYLEDDNAEDWEGALIVGLYILNFLTAAITIEYAVQRCVVIGTKMKQSIMLMIYDKLLNLSSTTYNQHTGSILATVGTDMEAWDRLQLIFFLPNFPIFWTICFVIIIYLTGYAGLVGFSIILLENVIVFFSNQKIFDIRKKIIGVNGQRIQFINNIIDGIRIVKLYAWENPFIKKLNVIRKLESRYHIYRIAIESVNRALNLSGLGIALLATFGIYTAMGETLDPGTGVATASALLVAHNVSTRNFVYSINFFTAVRASIYRAQTILLLKERKEIRKDSEKYVVQFKHVDAQWVNPQQSQKGDTERTLLNESFMLQDINFKARQGDLVIIGGQVGQGKTSLLLTVLGELNIVKGEVFAPKRASYVSQIPWIVSDTIKNNILMGNDFDEQRYQKCKDYSQLSADLNYLQYGDNTIVGENGITLSGGQKARLALARAMYSQHELILLDDPLSAVDADVGSKIFKGGIRKYLRGRTRILVTHHEQYFRYADTLILIENGQISFKGNFEQLQTIYNTYQYESLRLMSQSSRKPLAKEAPKQKAMFEQQEQGFVPCNIYTKYIFLGFKNIFFLLIFALVYIIGQLAYLSVLAWVSYWSNQPENEQDNDYYLITFAYIVITTIVFGYARNLFISSTFIVSSRNLHDNALEGLVKTKTKFFDKNPSGRMINRFTKDIAVGDDAMPFLQTELLYLIVTFIGNLIIIAIIYPLAVASFILVIIVMLFYLKYTLATTRELKRLQILSKSKILIDFTNCIQGLINIRNQGVQQYYREKLIKDIEYSSSTYVHYFMFMLFFALYTDISAQFIVYIVVIIMIIGKEQSGESNGFVLLLIFNVVNSIILLTRLLQEFITNLASIQRLFAYGELKPEGQFETQQTAEFQQGKIEFKNVSMRYLKDSGYVLQNLSFTIQSGQKVGIIGRTGSGKSSLIQVIFRMVPIQEGTILIDNIDTKTIGLHQLRRQMSIIPQSPTIFHGNLRTNLDPFGKIQDSELQAVLSQVNLIGKDLDQSPDFSMGEKQLLCLARAVLRNCKILVLDEATANVDMENDKLIQKLIRKNFQKQTVLTIAHRLSTIADSNLILSLDFGKLIDFDTPANLLANPLSTFSIMMESCEEAEKRKIYKLAGVS